MAFFASNISRARAIEIARAVADREGWPWRGEADISWGWTCWKVKSNRGSIGSHVWVEIHRQTGDVIKKAYLPR